MAFYQNEQPKVKEIKTFEGKNLEWINYLELLFWKETKTGDFFQEPMSSLSALISACCKKIEVEPTKKTNFEFLRRRFRQKAEAPSKFSSSSSRKCNIHLRAWEQITVGTRDPSESQTCFWRAKRTLPACLAASLT